MRHFHIFARLLSVIHFLCKDPTSLHWKGLRAELSYAKLFGGTILPLVVSSHFSGLKGVGLLKGFAALSFLGFFASLWLFLLSPFPIILSP